MNKLAAYLPVESKAHWANGCDQCKYGIVSAPELTGACEFYLERIVQHSAGDIEFCTCRADLAYKAAILNRKQQRIEEARRDPRMSAQAHRLTHPDIEIAASHIQNSYIMAQAPTIHMEGEPA